MNLQILIDKEKTILRKNILLVQERGRISNQDNSQVNFLLCTSCFWCASCLSSQMLSSIAAAKDSASLARCPSCIDGNIESTPIAENEKYKFDYDTKRGITMEFFR